MSGPPGSMPVSGGMPVSGSPAYGPPTLVGSPVAAPGIPPTPMAPARPPPRRGAAVPVLASLTVLLFLLAGAMTGLYISRTGQYNKERRTASSQRATITSQDDRIKELQDKLQKVNDELAATRRDLSGSQNLTDELKKQKSVIRNCLQLLADANQAAERGDRATATAKEREAQPVCEEAFGYLGT